MKRRDFVKFTAIGLLSLAAPWILSKVTTAEDTLESLGFRKTCDILHTNLGKDLRIYDVYDSYNHDRGLLNIIKYKDGIGPKITGKGQHEWVAEWTPYKDPRFITSFYCSPNKAGLIDALVTNKTKWRIV